MTKKQYFNILWGLSSVSIVLQAIAVLLLGAVQISEADPAEIRMSAAVLMLIIGVTMSIVVYGFIITMGLHFSQKIGARLLFLNGYIDLKKDIFKPAILVATMYASIYLIVHALLTKYAGGHFPWLYSFSNQNMNWFLSLFVVISMSVLEVINKNIWALLFVVSGIALLLKKIMRNISASRAILVSVFLCSLLPGLHSVWKHGIAMSAIVPSVEAIGQAMLLGLLFWKKGFETAVFCHLIIAFILYLVIPGVVFALGF